MRSAVQVRSVLGALSLALLCGPAASSTSPAQGDVDGDDEASLLQTQVHISANQTTQRKRDLVFIHVPFNFGHTVEGVAMFESEPLRAIKMNKYISDHGGYGDITRPASWAETVKLKKKGGEVWGHMHPDLQIVSNVTGCPMYYTPQKYWPKGLAEKYIGNKTTFGVLRDPYERLVAQFRGGIKNYGGGYTKMLETCDVNAAVKQMMLDYIDTGKIFAQGCTLVPQAEYWDGPYGIKIPVNNRQFPTSMNQVFVEQGYHDFLIHTRDILHVQKCEHVWAGDLDEETRSLVRQVYARDFDLLCKLFNYCDIEENCCIWQIPNMCPQKVLATGYQG